MRIGVYSGSFDPVHTGHAMVANYVAQWGGVDEVWLMVSRQNPLKEGRMPAEDCHRLAMASIVAKQCNSVKVSDFELSLPLPSFTYVTLCKLREKYPQHEFGMIIYPRPGYSLPNVLPEGVSAIGNDAPVALVSSTFVRETIAKGGNVNYFVPCKVADYINENNLYKI